MELKYQKKVIYEVDYNDWDEFINKYYGIKQYEIVAAEEYGNYESHSFTAKKGEDYDEEDIRDLKSGKFVPWVTHDIFQDLANNDAIPEGEYLISVFW